MHYRALDVRPEVFWAETLKQPAMDVFDGAVTEAWEAC